jgi:hypothetical protein
MLGRWFKRKIQLAALEAVLTDLSRFMLALEGMDAQEVAELLMLATLARVLAEKNGEWPTAVCDLHAPADKAAAVQAAIVKQARALQKDGNTAAAAALMVWLHSLRAGAYPEARLLGRRMWEQMSRGHPLIPEAMRRLEQQGIGMPTQLIMEAYYTPEGLEPQR